MAEIRRGALFAQQDGKLSIEPLELNVLAMVQKQRRRTGTIMDLFDDPFFSAQQAVERKLTTNRVNVNVRSLPVAPEGFTGGVGHFSVNGGINLDKVKANEAVSYRVTVTGSGNLMLINAPHPDFPSVFEVYDPQIEDNLRKDASGVSGSRTYEWILIPRSQGNYTIPALDFVYFDPSAGQYRTLRVEAQKLKVERGNGSAVAAAKDDVRLLNQDINYIHPIQPSSLKLRTFESHAGWMFWLATVMIMLLTGAVLVFVRRRQEEEQDVVAMRRKRAARMAKKRLKRAAAYLNDNDANHFYEEIYRAVWGCLADKYSIEQSQLNRETVGNCLAEKQVPEAQQQSIMQLLQDVDFARFAPGDAHAQMQSIYDEALNMIVGFEG